MVGDRRAAAACACKRRELRATRRKYGRYNRTNHPTKALAMDPEHVNAIGNTLEGLKERTAQLRRYL